jgi:hypothetical protein
VSPWSEDWLNDTALRQKANSTKDGAKYLATKEIGANCDIQDFLKAETG